MHEAEPAHAHKLRPRLPFNVGRIISESKHAGNAVKISGMKLTSARSLNVFSSQMDRSVHEVQCVCVCVGWVEGSIIQCYQPLSFHA